MRLQVAAIAGVIGFHCHVHALGRAIDRSLSAGTGWLPCHEGLDYSGVILRVCAAGLVHPRLL